MGITSEVLSSTPAPTQQQPPPYLGELEVKGWEKEDFGHRC